MFEIKEYNKASSVKEAVKLLSIHTNSKLIAGGTDVLIKLRHGEEKFTSLIDIHDLAELKFVEKDSEETIIIGSGMKFAELAKNDIILKHIPVISEASNSVGGPQIRNIATIGGNLCNGAVSADSAASLLVLDAILEIEGTEGVRELPINDFYLGPGKVDLKKIEILKTIKIKKENYLRYGICYYKYATRNAMDIATIGCAAACKIDNNKIDKLKIAFTVAAPKPVRSNTSEEFAKGKELSDELIKKICDLVMHDLTPRDSWRASKEFRIHIIKTITEKVITRAIKEAKGLQLSMLFVHLKTLARQRILFIDPVCENFKRRHIENMSSIKILAQRRTQTKQEVVQGSFVVQQAYFYIFSIQPEGPSTLPY